MLKQAVPEATKHAMKFWMSVFNSFCHEKGLTLDLTSCSAVEFDGVLHKFHAGLRTKTGGFYKRSSYLAARAGIQSHLDALNCRVNIFSQTKFCGSSNVLDAVLKKNKSDGLERQVLHNDAITEEDKKRLGTYFADVLETNDTYKLQFFCLVYHHHSFRPSGWRSFVQTRKQDLVFEKDADGEEYMKLDKDS